jgi:hypothetical protein
MNVKEKRIVHKDLFVLVKIAFPLAHPIRIAQMEENAVLVFVM